MNALSPCVREQFGQHRDMHIAAKYVGLASLVCSVALAACSTDNGTSTPPDEETVPHRDPPADDTRPEFDASFGGGSTDAGVDQAAPAEAGAPCSDPNDPGGSETVAAVLAETDDCDNDFKTVNGILQSAVDLDFYKLSGLDKNFCSLDTDFEAKTAGMQLCVFLRCKNSTVDAVTGCAQGVEATSDTGMKGCCTEGPGHAVPSWDCSGIADDDSADIVLRVKADKAATCVPYQYTYRF